MLQFLLLFCLPLLLGCASAHPQQVAQPDLARLAGAGQLRVVNRAVTPLREAGRRGLRFDSRPLNGLAWLPGVALREGSVEFDVRGKDVLQRSFVGLAFHGLNDSTFEAVYFRPFNFRHAEAERRAHAVQYVAEPEFPWNRLRREFPGRYEVALTAPPAPTEWFHVRVLIGGAQVQVFVNDEAVPSLQVAPLRTAAGAQLGLFVGDNSDGDFANLRIRAR
ncbi:hypothetical protein LJ737_18220 [Hymenobacter sp. 15J16-1T3B]|uniref:hypothetical protein n=1 Tax=Hymenobacter sp. 15J16-1T3B TaxID=2886941 RepID=UPI001D0F7E4F|nr:hypothetical protein [Hymenobacter sp. 15J16-1T3B]MCC3159183.1 hypothetical protein [Hymenobacter sp. 15J16-1T3B]